MSIKETLQADLTEAIRGRNEIVSGTIRMVLTAITNEEVSGKEARVLTDAEIITVLSREAKKRREAAEAFADAGRADKAALEKSEGEVIAKYLPEQMSEDEIKKLIHAAIAQTGASGPGDMGKVMGVIKSQVAGKADGGTVSGIVKAALNNCNLNTQQFHCYLTQQSRSLRHGVLMVGNSYKLFLRQVLVNNSLLT